MKLTLLLVIANIAIFFLTTGPNLTISENYASTFGFSINNFLSGKYHTTITAMFLHGDLFHLGFNMLSLFFLGWAVESKVKNWQYLLVYFLAGIFGSLILFIPIFGYTSNTIAIGASAAISGLVGLGIFIRPWKFVMLGSIIPLPFIVAAALFFLLNITNLFMPSQIAYAAHLGGMSIGFLFGLVWGKERTKSIFLFIFIILLIILLPYLLEFVIG